MLSITKSRYMDTDNPTKTAASEREIKLSEHLIFSLRSLKPLHVTESEFVFKNHEGNPVGEDKWRAKYWYRALRACGIRPRKFYSTRHTFISDALSHGLNIKWVAEYCGTSVAMIEKHYGKYIKNDSDEQLKRLYGAKTETFTETQSVEEVNEARQIAGILSGSEWSGRVDSNHRPHGPEPCALPS
jgi:integrase